MITCMNMLQHVHAGYHSYAERALVQSGMSVAMIEAVLDEKELAEARHATITRDAGALQRLGDKGMVKLSKLPKTDPVAFKALLREKFPNLKVKWINGEAVVPGEYGATSWAYFISTKKGRF